MRTALLTLSVCVLALPANAQYSGGTGEPNDPYQIATAADLIALGETPEDYDKHFILTADIDIDPNLPGRRVFDKAVIAPDMDPCDLDWRGGPLFTGAVFTGVLDGQGHTISHLTVNGGNYLGLFGQLGYGAQVRDLGIADADIMASGTEIGALAGANVCGSVTRCHSSGVVSGASNVGGLVGCNDWGSISESHSSDSVSGNNTVGGLVGHNRDGSIVASFWDIETSGQATSMGGTGKTTAEMQTASTFIDAGWDFVGETANGTEDIWWILEGKDYPRLWWETTEE